MSADQAPTGQDPLRLTIEEVGAANRRAQIDGESSTVDSAPHLGIESLVSRSPWTLGGDERMQRDN